MGGRVKSPRQEIGGRGFEHAAAFRTKPQLIKRISGDLVDRKGKLAMEFGNVGKSLTSSAHEED